ncbi:antibiotic biosynthesis monooxygenase [Streptomyces narbonensis]|uniref:antibiotic biosynthesis monooxygenase n=1 Tax=Streptomyces narbonensis TaxID=67333 RepID=UPI00167583C7|nr:antibiotic biosynthesis monooxygenase [Streptomyces narbonensis]GGV96035.1 antibiotic biosynthesis monooxygenase [Streptomyces narbonensis]
MNAVAHPDARPEIHRPGVEAVLVSTWSVGTPERQRAAVEAVRKAWESREWPDPRLLGYTVYCGTDGDTLLQYAQWATHEAYDDFVHTRRDDRDAEIDAAVPGIERVEPHRYAPPYRTAVLNEESAGAVPGLVAAVEVEFDGPDAGRQRAWVDSVFTALAQDEGSQRIPGAIGAQFHLSADGTRALDLAEWESEQAHTAWLMSLATSPVGEAWAAVANHPGIAGSRVRKFTPALSLNAGV